MDLSQCYFDILHLRINSNLEHIHVSRSLHAWILDCYQATMSDHPNKCDWSLDNIIDLSSVLDNPKQAGFDCGLHTCVIPFMIQDFIPLEVLGPDSCRSGSEIRIRTH